MAKSLSIIVLLVAILVGAFYNGLIPTSGLLRWLGSIVPGLTGMSAAFTPMPWGYTYDQFNKEVNLKGKTTIVTGGNSGIGYFAALNMARKGANVILACRNPSKCNAAATEITNNITATSEKENIIEGGAVECMKLDTSLLSSVRDFAANYLKKFGGRPLDILLLNAGIGYDFNRPNGTVDGIEATFATNHVGHHLLYMLLKRNLFDAARQKGDARVVLTSSAANHQAKSVPLSNEGWLNLNTDYIYASTKLAQILFVQEAARQLSEDARESFDESFLNIHINAAHPGLVDTNIFAPFSKRKENVSTLGAKFFLAFVDYCRNNGWIWTAEDGALTILYLATSPSVAEKNIRGKYFVPQAIQQSPNKLASNETLQKELWKLTDTLVTR